MVSAKVKSVESSGALFTLKGTPMIGLAVSGLTEDVDLKPGKEVSAVVLDIDEGRKVIDLSLKASLVKARKQPSGELKALRSALQKDSNLRADVELQKDGYLVVSLPGHGSVIGCVSVQDYNISQNIANDLSAKRNLAVTLAPSSPLHAHRLLFVLREAMTMDVPVSSQQLEDFPIGTVVQCKIQSIKGKDFCVFPLRIFPCA